MNTEQTRKNVFTYIISTGCRYITYTNIFTYQIIIWFSSNFLWGIFWVIFIRFTRSFYKFFRHGLITLLLSQMLLWHFCSTICTIYWLWHLRGHFPFFDKTKQLFLCVLLGFLQLFISVPSVFTHKAPQNILISLELTWRSCEYYPIDKSFKVPESFFWPYKSIYI